MHGPDLSTVTVALTEAEVCRENVRSSCDVGWCVSEALAKHWKKIICRHGVCVCVYVCRGGVAKKGYCEHDGNSHGAAPDQ